jgi:hypothetical protein
MWRFRYGLRTIFLAMPTESAQAGYNLRQGAAAYAPIVGTFGALAVPAIIVLFTVPKPLVAHRVAFVTLAAGLLIVGMIGSLIGSIGLGAVGAEREATANLPPAIMFVAVPVVVSIVAILGAFEVLSAIYLPESRTLFALIAGAGGLSGVFFTAFAIGDSWQLGPTDPHIRKDWLSEQWVAIRTHEAAYKWTKIVAGVSSVPILLGMILRLCGLHVTPTLAAANWLVGSGLVLAMIGTYLGNTRTAHPYEGVERGLQRWEAFGTTLTLSFYILALLIFLP